MKTLLETPYIIDSGKKTKDGRIIEYRDKDDPKKRFMVLFPKARGYK